MWGLCANTAQLQGGYNAPAYVHSYVGLTRFLTVCCGIRSLESYTIPFIYRLFSRKLLNSEVFGNASSNGNSYFTVLNASGFLICTNTEGPSRDRAPSFYILIILFYVGRSWWKTPHILKRPFTYTLTKSTTRRVNASVLISELKHRPTQCLCLVRSKLTVTI